MVVVEVEVLLVFECIEDLQGFGEPTLFNQQAGERAIDVLDGVEKGFLNCVVETLVVKAKFLIDVDGPLTIKDGRARIIKRAPRDHHVIKGCGLAVPVPDSTIKGQRLFVVVQCLPIVAHVVVDTADVIERRGAPGTVPHMRIKREGLFLVIIERSLILARSGIHASDVTQNRRAADPISERPA